MFLRLSLILAAAACLTTAQDTAGIRCNRPMCMIMCDLDFKTDADGCPICECLEDPCAAADERQVCPADTACEPQKCTSHPCTELGAKCTGMPMFECAMPMCETFCPVGYEKDENGCMTCVCKTPESCEDMSCSPGLICKMLEETPKCVAPPLCQKQAEAMIMVRGELRGVMPDCEENGDFNPTQCSSNEMPDERRECWCVDDRGKEMDGSRQKLNTAMSCEKKKTRVLHVEMTLVHEFVNIEEHIGGLESPLKHYASTWLAVDEEMINVEEITPQGDLVKEIYVHISVVSNGLVDLPSAADYLKQICRQSAFIPYHDKVLQAKPDSVRVRHEYDEPKKPLDIATPKMPQEFGEEPTPVTCWFPFRNNKNHKLTIILSSVGAVVILVCFIGIAVMISKMRRNRQFKHKKLENMETFKKNLVLATDITPDITAEKKEKLEEVSVA